MSDTKQISILCVLMIVVGISWYKVYVEPMDQYRAAIIDCTDGDRSRAAYDFCVSLIGKTQ
jgi:hypothetical protein